MNRLLREPLVHFLLIGAALFALFDLVGGGRTGVPGVEGGGRTIVVGAGRIEQLARVFFKTWQRPPTAAELRGLVDDFVLEEAYYRQAVQMGIDENDTMIRRRLRQKLEFLTDDVAAAADPPDEALAGFLAERPAGFTTDALYTFRHLYFNPERHGDDPVAAVRSLADELRAGGAAEGDRTLLPESFENAPARAVDGTFGTGFARQLDSLEPGVWSDPVESGLGLHLVLLESLTPPRVPPLDEIRGQVTREWSHARRLEFREQFDRELLEGYEIVIDWPEVGAGESGDGGGAGAGGDGAADRGDSEG